MHTGLSGITGGIVEYALDGLALRHSAIAANIANANSVGYRPLRVSFENQLTNALAQSGGKASPDSAPMHLPPPQVSADLPVSEGVRRNALENEIVQLNRNVLQYQALIRGLDKYHSTIATAVNDGKR